MVISISLLLSSVSTTLLWTDLNIFNDLILFIDFAAKIELNSSPSSTSNWFLITFSCVILLPKTLIRLILNFSPSETLKLRFILFSSISSTTSDFKVLYSSSRII